MIFEIFITAFVTFFIAIDPLGVSPIFAGLTQGETQKQKFKIALKGVVTSAVVLFLFAFFGKTFLSSLGISLDAFRVAGGLLLLLVAIDMVFEKRTERRNQRAEEIQASDEPGEDIAIFPLAIPMIAGPGAITAVMLTVTAFEGDLQAQGIVYGTLFLVLVLTYVILVAAGWLVSLLGPSITTGLTRILGVVLAALSVQYIFDGIKNLVGF
ncbi:MAG: MarC family protein [Sphingomonadales bacterium]